MGPDPTAETPEDPFEGEAGPDITDGSGCTNYGQPPANCITVTGSGLHVSEILVAIRTHGTYSGRWKVLLNGSLFVRSPVVTVHDHFTWTWDKDWLFHENDEVCGGFWLTTGGWFNAPGGPACVTVHS